MTTCSTQGIFKLNYLRKKAPNIRNTWTTCSASRREDRQYILPMSTSTWKDGVKHVESVSTQQCQAIGQEVKTDVQEVPLEHGKELPHYAGALWIPPHWRYSRTVWKPSGAMCSRKTLLNKAGWPRWPHRWSHPTSAILHTIPWYHHLP